MCEKSWSYVMRCCRHCGVEFVYRFSSDTPDGYIHAGLKVELALDTHICANKPAQPDMPWWKRIFFPVVAS